MINDRQLVLKPGEGLNELRRHWDTKGSAPIHIRGFRVCMSTMKLATFRRKGLVCAACGIEGMHFAIERRIMEENSQAIRDMNRHIPYEMNLYALNDDGEEVMMTCGLVIPKSQGGKNNVTNTQPLCSQCKTKGAGTVMVETG